MASHGPNSLGTDNGGFASRDQNHRMNDKHDKALKIVFGPKEKNISIKRQENSRMNEPIEDSIIEGMNEIREKRRNRDQQAFNSIAIKSNYITNFTKKWAVQSEPKYHSKCFQTHNYTANRMQLPLKEPLIHTVPQRFLLFMEMEVGSILP